MNKMKNVRIEKLTLNVGAGIDQEMVRKGLVLLEKVTGRQPVRTLSKKRIPVWGVRPGLPVGCMVTVRGKQAEEILGKLLDAIENKLKKSCFKGGNVNFGLSEYMDIEGLKYDPDIGIMGFNVSVTLERAGYRIKRRKFKRKKLSEKERITQQDAIDFMKNKFKTEVIE